MPADRRRLVQLYNAALDLGMSKTDAEFYAREALTKEKMTGEWSTRPHSAEALANDHP